MGKRAEVNWQIAPLSKLLKPLGRLDSFSPITHLDSLLDKHAASGANVEQAAAWLKLLGYFKDLPRLRASLLAPCFIGRVHELFIERQNFSEIRTLQELTARALINRRGNTICAISDGERITRQMLRKIRGLH